MPAGPALASPDLGVKAFDPEIVSLNPGTVYWMDAINFLAITLKKIQNKGSQMGHTKILKMALLQLTKFNNKISLICY